MEAEAGSDEAALTDDPGVTEQEEGGGQVTGEQNRSTLPPNPFPRRVKAPPLSGGVEWLNSAGPIELERLRGKIVLLDFWTYCCINCMHILPHLKRLEQKYADELVVIGVHSAKFLTERESENIREAILRYEIEHPVVNDANMVIWRRYGARAWPTLVLIDPEGYAVLKVSGEGWFDVIERAIEALIAYHEARGTLKRGRLLFGLESVRAAATPLRFPGKVYADAASNRLFITDSNHNRIVICTLDGKLLDVIGSGQIGAKDGSFEEAQFFRPQGVELVGQTLYIADTENHLIRAADLEERVVRTVAGTGKQGWERPFDAQPALQTALSSPWDVCWVGSKLYVAMAGLHQIWVYDPVKETIRVFSGSGREGILDGDPDIAEFAQPSGLSTDGTRLFVADAESSGVRIVYPDRGGLTETIVGLGLFEFGDRDGIGSEVRLQHPLAVQHWRDDDLFVADTYNNKVKLLNARTRRCTTWIGSRQAGSSLNPLQLNEPGGLAIAHGKLFIADTNNHRIVVVDLKGKQARELPIDGLTPPRRDDEAQAPDADGDDARPLPPQDVKPGGQVIARVRIDLPQGLKLNPAAPMGYVVRGIAADGTELTSETTQLEEPRREFTVALQVPPQVREIRFFVTVQYFPCEVGSEGICYVAQARWLVPVRVRSDGHERAEVSLIERFSRPGN